MKMEFLKLDIQYFGASNHADSSSTSSVGNNKSTLYCKFTEATPTDTDIVQNRTWITAYCTYKQGGSFSSYSTPKLKLTWYDDNANKKGKSLGTLSVTAMSSGAVKKIAPDAFAVTHKSDGTLNGYLKAEWVWTGGGYACKSTTATTSNTALTTLPRATTPVLDATEYELGQPITISLPRASENFTHDLYYKVGNSATIRFADDVDTEYVWENNLRLINWITNNVEGDVTIYCETYNGETLVGDKSITFKGKVPETIVPEIETFVVSEYVTDVTEKVGKYLKGKSKLSINVSAKGRYASTITNYKIEANGETFTTQEALTSVLVNSGTQEVKLTVTDSRKRTSTQTIEIEVVDYYSPKANSLFVYRCNSDGTLNEEGTYLKASMSYDIAPIENLNSKNISLQYFEGEQWVTLYNSTSSYSTDDETYTSTQEFSVDNNYQVRLMVEDLFASDYFGATLEATFSLINFHKDGKALSFGKVATRPEGVQFGDNIYDQWDTIISNGVAISDENPDTTLETLIKTSTNSPTGSEMYFLTFFAKGKTEDQNRGQIAVPCLDGGSMYYRYRIDGVWTDWKEILNVGDLNENYNKKTAVGITASDMYYIRGTKETGEHRQLRIQDDAIAYEKYDGSSWSTTWKKSATQGDFLTIVMSTDFTLSSTSYTTIPFDTIYSQNGSSLSLTIDGGIKIGAGVKSIAVSGQYYYYTGTNGSKGIQVSRNSSVVCRCVRQAENYTTIDLPTQRFNVSEGDVIYLQAIGSSGDLIKYYYHSTHFSVEVIA